MTQKKQRPIRVLDDTTTSPSPAAVPVAGVSTGNKNGLIIMLIALGFAIILAVIYFAVSSGGSPSNNQRHTTYTPAPQPREQTQGCATVVANGNKLFLANRRWTDIPVKSNLTLEIRGQGGGLALKCKSGSLRVRTNAGGEYVLQKGQSLPVTNIKISKYTVKPLHGGSSMSLYYKCLNN